MKKKINILIADDDRRMVRTMVDILKAKGFKAEGVFSGFEALEKVKNKHFDCVLTDIKMPQMDGVNLLKAIKEVQPDLPIVLMTAYTTDKLVKNGLEEGAIASLNKPLDINLLLNLFSSLRKEQSIVIVDDDLKFCRTMGDILHARGFDVTLLSDPHGIEKNLKTHDQVILLDMKLKGINGLEVLKQVREKFPSSPVIIMTGYRTEMAQAIETALKIKAHACLYKPFEIEKLLQILNEIRQKELGRIMEKPLG